MGERSLQACIEAELDVLRDAIRRNGQCGSTLQTWYDDGAYIEYLLAGLDADTESHDAVYAWGYLNGCADHCDMTVMEYIHSLGLSLDEGEKLASVTTKPRHNHFKYGKSPKQLARVKARVDRLKNKKRK